MTLKFAVKADGDKFSVYRLDEKDQPFGKAIKTFDTQADAAVILPELDRRLSVGGKDYWDDDDYWCDYNYGPYLSNSDPRVKYDPLGGSKTKACANCAFFQASGARCYLKSGDTVATGLCDLWLTTERPVVSADPIPVVIVEPTAAAGNAGLRETFNQIGDKIKALAESFPLLQKKGDTVTAEGATDNALIGGFKVYDGGVWAAWWSNSFKDKHGEIFSDSSHDSYVWRVESGVVPYPELWYRHMPVAAGKALWLGRIGHMMLAAGKFYDTEAGQKFYEHYKNDDQPRTVSHGYIFLNDDKKDGVYSQYNTYEISPLYAGEEANPYTGFGVKELSTMITQAKKNDLISIIGAELTEKYLQFGEERSKELEALGIKFKSDDPAPLVDESARTAAAAVASKQAELETKIAEQEKQFSETLTAIQKSLEELTGGEKTRNEAVATMQKQLNEALGMQPRASQNSKTVISPDDPYIKFMQTKENEQVPENGSGVGGLFGQILDGTNKS